MPLDPQCAAIIEAAAAAGGAPFDQQDPVAARLAYNAGSAAFRHSTEPLESVTDRSFSAPGGAVPVRIYRSKPEHGVALPVVVFYHGGGWTIGDLDSHDHMCRHLAVGAHACVVSVDYRLSPEHKFPAAYEDCIATVQWIVDNADELGVDSKRIALAGDSAGGNLAATTAIALRDMDGPKVSAQILMYPAVDFTADNTSIRENGSGYLLTRGALERFANFYLPNRAARSDPRASPQLRSNHANLPHTFIQTAEFDPLRDEGRRYAETLMAAGTAVEYKCYPGMIHGFARMCTRVDAAIAALDDACGWLCEEFAIK